MKIIPRFYTSHVWNSIYKSLWLFQNNLSQRTTKPTIRLVQPAKNSDQLAYPRSLIRVFTDRVCLLQSTGYPKRINENCCHIWWMYRLIWVFAGHTGLIVGFVVHWLYYYHVFDKFSWGEWIDVLSGRQPCQTWFWLHVKRGLLQKERICSPWSQILPLDSKFTPVGVKLSPFRVNLFPKEVNTF